MTDSTQRTQQQQQSQSNPWLPTEGTLQGIIGGLNGLRTGVTPGQSAAINNLTGSVNGLPNYGGAAANATTNLFTGLPNFYNQNYNDLNKTLQPFLDPSYLDPTNAPGIKSALGYIKDQVTNSVNGEFAGAGRDLSPANSTVLAYGLGSAEAPYLFNQYNQNVGTQLGAANTRFGAGSQTGSNVTGAYGAGAEMAGQQPNIAAAPALARLQAAQTAYGLPYSNIGTKEGMILPIAGLGGYGSGSGSGSVTYNPSLLSSVGAGLKMVPQAAGTAAGIFGGFNTPFFQNGWGLPNG